MYLEHECPESGTWVSREWNMGCIWNIGVHRVEHGCPERSRVRTWCPCFHSHLRDRDPTRKWAAPCSLMGCSAACLNLSPPWQRPYCTIFFLGPEHLLRGEPKKKKKHLFLDNLCLWWIEQILVGNTVCVRNSFCISWQFTSLLIPGYGIGLGTLVTSLNWMFFSFSAHRDSHNRYFYVSV